MILRRLVELYRKVEERERAKLEYLRRAYEHSERLRAELSHLEHEIYELWESNLPRRQKQLMEQVLQTRCSKVRSEMERLAWEVYNADRLG